MNQGGRAAATAALFLGSLMFAVASAEVVARSFWSPPRAAPAPPIREEWKDLPQNHSVLSMSMPNQRFLVSGALFETNEFGFRGPTRPRDSTSDRLRIVLIGDSFAMGWGVVYEDTYGAILETMGLPGPHGPVSVEVLNFALAGVNTFGAVSRLRDEALSFDPDLIVYGASVNDIEGPHYRGTFADWDRTSPGQFVLWRIFRPRLMNLTEGIWPLPGSYVYDLDENYFRNVQAWTDLIAGFDELREATESQGICAALLVHTQLHRLKERHPYERHYAALTTAAKERGLYPIQSFDRFQGREPTSLWANAADAHPGPLAHRILAEALAEGLQGLPTKCFKL